MNLIFGLCFTLVGAVLFLLYLWVPYLIYIVVRREWAMARYDVTKPENESNLRPVWFRKFDKPLVIFMAVVTFSMTGFTYIRQRVEWMGDDNAHLKAKEYWVAGQVIAGYRSILDIFVIPDSWLISPFIGLQKMIYNQGIKHLPENDGEIGVWTNNWFIYPISKTMGKPKDVNKRVYSPPMIEFLETAWEAIEQQASFPFADRQMEIQQYYRNFPGQVSYYNYRKGHYAGDKVGSMEFYTRDEKMISRSKKLVKWLNELEKKWKISPEIKSFLKTNPKVAVIRQVACLMELKDIITYEIMIQNFTCENESVRQYLKLRKAFAGNGSDRPPYKRMTDFKQSKRLYNMAINTVANRFIRYTLQKYCSLEAAGKEDMSKYEGWGIPIEEKIERSMNNLFKDEIKKLEEWKNVN